MPFRDGIHERSGPEQGSQIWRSSVNIHHSDVDSALDSRSRGLTTRNRSKRKLWFTMLFVPRKATYLISSLQKFDTCPIIVKLSTLTRYGNLFHVGKKKNVRNFLKCKNWRVKSNFPFDTVIRYEFQSNKSQFALHRKLIEIFLTLAACTPLYIQWRDLNPLWKY